MFWNNKIYEDNIFCLEKWPKGTTPSSQENEQPGYEISWSGSLAAEEKYDINSLPLSPYLIPISQIVSVLNQELEKPV